MQAEFRTGGGKLLSGRESRKRAIRAACIMEPLERRVQLSGTFGTLTDLGTLGGQTSFGQGINASGEVTGESLTTGDGSVFHAFTSNGGPLTDLGTLGGNSSFASAINNSGEVVGYSQNAAEKNHGFFDTGNGLQKLGTFGGGISVAYGVNNSGQIVGYSTVANGNQHPFLYSNGVMTDLGTFGGTESQALSINGSGQITGFSNTNGASDPHAFLDSGSGLVDLGTLGGTDSEGSGLNNSGQVVGDSKNAAGNDHAFLYSGGVMSDLGTLGGDLSQAYRINGQGQIVGKAQIAGDTAYHAFIYSGGRMIDLNSLINPASGWVLVDADGITNSDQITGYGVVNGLTHGFVLSVALPNVTSASQSTFTVGTAGTFTVTTTGSPSPTLKEINALPAGVTFVDNGDGTATLSGTPAAGTGGNYVIAIRARNGLLPNATQNFTLTVDQSPAIISANTVTFTEATSGQFKVKTTGFPISALSESGDTLPTGVSFVDLGNGRANLSGAPILGSQGTYHFTIKAVNKVNPRAQQNFTLIVQPLIAAGAPAIIFGSHGNDSLGGSDADSEVLN